MDFEMLLTILDSFFTEREREILKNRLGCNDIVFTKEDLSLSISEVYKKYNLSLISAPEICEKYRISEAQLKQIESKFMHKSGLNQKERLNRLKEYLNNT